MLEIKCPECKMSPDNVPHVVEVLPGRTYKFKCDCCGSMFILKPEQEAVEGQTYSTVDH